jgi:hypothetical protein
MKKMQLSHQLCSGDVAGPQKQQQQQKPRKQQIATVSRTQVAAVTGRSVGQLAVAVKKMKP